MQSALVDEAATTADTGMVALPDCHGMAADLDPDAANLCAEHCKVGQQSHELPAVFVPVPELSALYALRLAPVLVPPPRPIAAMVDALVAASPPLAVLHCVYRI
jgi:hypothetical protein